MHPSQHWKTYTTLSVLFLFVTTCAAFVSRLWVITAIPIGFLFGFFMQKGDLCGSSAFSEVILMKDGRKAFGLWICIVVSMLGFALLDLLGLVRLSPKPMLWVSYLVGGLLFGSGMVLAGGCVSGCLYKAATGNLNSMAALLAMPFGMAMAEYGPLRELSTRMAAVVTKGPDGGVLSLPAVTGIPYWALAVFLAAGTLASVGLWSRKAAKRKFAPPDEPVLRRVLTRSWKPWQAGLAIGLLASFAYLSSAATGRNYPLGVTHGVLAAYVLITDQDVSHVYQKAPQLQSAATATGQANPANPTPRKKVTWWLVLLVTFYMAGAFVSGKLSGEARLLPKPPEQTLVAIVGGFLVGAGAVFATGCVIGNILSGWALMSLGMVLFGVVTVLSNWAATYIYLMGGSLFSRG
jgi:hypothetical protein